MNWFFWKKKKPEPILENWSLVEKFTTNDEPKLVDFPKGAYKAFWEILLDAYKPGGYIARIRFYGYEGAGLITEEVLIKPTVKELKVVVNDLILTKMETFKR